MSAVVVTDGKVLLVRRLAEPYRGKWSLPGGTVAGGESLRDAVRREVAEETGLVVEAEEVVDVLDAIVPADRPEFHYVLTVFRARLLGGTLQAGSDAGDARWVPFDGVARLDVTDSTRDVIAAVRPGGRRGPHM